MKKSQISFSKNVIASAPVLSEACGERSRTVEGTLPVNPQHPVNLGNLGKI